jgi:hypothetical protein
MTTLAKPEPAVLEARWVMVIDESGVLRTEMRWVPAPSEHQKRDSLAA